jgi:hypothetical protein
MKIIDKILWIEFADFIKAGWKEAAVWNANLRNGSYWQMTRNPDDKRKPLVQYDSLRPKHKEKLTAQFGNPYEYISKEPLMKMFTLDAKAEAFYRSHRYNDDKQLPQEHINKYTIAASWLNLINSCLAEKSIIKKDLSLTVDKFWTAMAEIITAENIGLPANYRKLHQRCKDYQDKGYEVLISGLFGNKIAAKMGKAENGFDAELYQKQLAFIRTAASFHQNFDAQQITDNVNVVFRANGWPELSHKTVANVMDENKHLTIPGSRGKKVYNNLISRHVKRSRPNYPLAYCTLDGWTVELLYQDGKTYDNRMVVVIVLDTMNNYPIGYAIGDSENAELIRAANRNSIAHANELFGGPYRPWQLQSDNFAIKQNTPFFKAVAHLHTPAAVGNSKAKVIEPYFNYINKTYCQFQKNWSGHNVTASQNNQPNIEMLNKIKSTFPDKAGVIAQIENFIYLERKTKAPQYLTAWDECTTENKALLSTEDCIMIFGKPHSHSNSITGEGLRITIEGHRYVYDSFDPKFRAMRHLKFNIVYDDKDLSRVVAVQPEARKSFVLEQTHLLPMDVRSMQPDDHKYLGQVRTFNKERIQEVIETYASDRAIVDEVMTDTILLSDDKKEAIHKLMFIDKNGQQKTHIQNAKGLKPTKKEAIENKKMMDEHLDYLETKTDFSKYD